MGLSDLLAAAAAFIMDVRAIVVLVNDLKKVGGLRLCRGQ